MTPENSKANIAISPSTPDQYDRAQRLAGELKIPVVQMNSKEFPYLLICSAEGLKLKQTAPKSPGPILVSFSDAVLEYRLQHGGGRKQALARAVGLKKGWQPAVLDATAGLGRDGFILAHLGCQVQMLERSAILYVMLHDGLDRAKLSKKTRAAADRIRITHADSQEFLQNIALPAGRIHRG